MDQFRDAPKASAVLGRIFGVPRTVLLGNVWVYGRRLALGVVILLSLAAFPAAAADEAVTYPVGIGPLTFRLPAAYVALIDAHESAPTQGFALVIRWPSMAGYFSPDGGLPPRETNREPTLNMSYTYYRNSEPMNLHARFETINKAFALVAGPDDLPGMRHYQSTARHMPGLDYYFSEDSNINTTISCDSPERTYPPLVAPPYPRCTYDQRQEHTYITIGFSREYLPQWREVKKKTEDLLDSFVLRNIRNR